MTPAGIGRSSIVGEILIAEHLLICRLLGRDIHTFFVKSLFTCQIIKNELVQAGMIFILTTGREPYAEHRDQQKYP